MNKFKYKKKNKHIKLRYIFLILPIFLISLGIAYSKFSTNLSIIGSVKSVNQAEQSGNSLYTYTVRSSWPGYNSRSIYNIYDVHLPILNLDEDYTKAIEIEFDITDGLLLEQSTNNCNVWQVEEIIKDGNRIKLIFKEYACWFLNGTILDLYFQFPFEPNSEIKISNLTLNGKEVTYVTELPTNN